MILRSIFYFHLFFLLGLLIVIIRRYIIKETFKAQIAILFILFMIFFSQKLIRILSSAIDGDVPNNLIMPLLMFGIANMVQLILPLSLFMGILIAFGRFYASSEMVAMFACGVKKSVSYQAVAFLSFITCLFTIFNLVWFSPWSSIQQERLMENVKVNPSLAGLLAGQFQNIPNGDGVIYIGNAEKNQIKNVFIAQTGNNQSERPSIILADGGTVEQDTEGNQIINLNNANRYEGTIQLKDFRISNFIDYRAIIQPKKLDDSQIKNKVDQLSFHELKQIHTPAAKAEYQWRISLILSVPIMAFLVIPLTESNPRQGRMARILPAILLYLVFFLLESSIKAHGSKGRIDPVIWFNVVNACYFLLAIIFNLWNSPFIKKIRYMSASNRFA